MSLVDENARFGRNYALILRAQSRDEKESLEATETLLRENMGLVRNVVLKFRERGVEYEDLIQIGTMGMLRAIRTFDLSRGTAFSTFAVPLIVGEIRRYLRDDGMIRVSRSYKKLAMELTRMQREIAEREGREASIAELAAACGTGKEEAAVAFAAISPVASLSEPLFEGEKEEIGDRLTDDESANEASILSDRLALREAIGRMPPLWRKILLLRYYRDRTQQQTADLLGLTQVKVSREEKKILAFLRGQMIV